MKNSNDNFLCNLFSMIRNFFQQQKTGNISDNKTPQKQDELVVDPIKTVTAVLCLVVPASVARMVSNINIKETYPISINAEIVKTLIDNASYFMCIKLEDAESLNLQFTNEEILNIGDTREVLAKIQIINAYEMIGKTSTYILKRNLSSSGQATVVKLAPLKNLSGLEKFYCV